MIEVVSLVGLSYSGKSTLAEGLVSRLADAEIEADIIKKDEALKSLGRERYGADDKTGGYSVLGFLKHGQIPSGELHEWMNNRVRSSLAAGHLAVLEGGTRTRTAQAETLRDVELDEDGLLIGLLQLPFRELMNRARQRHKESGRYDDGPLIAAAKLVGQYKGAWSKDAPQPSDPDILALDATRPTDELVDLMASKILHSCTTHP